MTSKRTRVIGLGAGGHASVVIDILRLAGDVDIVGLLDVRPELHGQTLLGIPILGDDSMIGTLRAEGVSEAFIGVGGLTDTAPRRRLFEQAIANGLGVVSAVHPRAVVSDSVKVGRGITVMARAVINAGSRIGDNVVVNTGAILEHGVVIRDHAHVATGAQLAGDVVVETGAHVGIGAIVRQGIRIGARAVVGAGAVVVEDVPPNVVVAGVPARVLRKAEPVKSVHDFFVPPTSTIREVIARIDRNQRGVAIVVDADRKLLGTITDGDVRRALLSGDDLSVTAADLLAHKPADTRTAVVAPVGTDGAELLDLMREQDLRHIPIVDPDGRVVDVAVLSDLVGKYQLPLRALIMAGGFGTRLRPLTDDIPKTMLPVGDKPLLEHIVRQLQGAGIHHVSLATHYRADLIEQHFGDGRNFDVTIQYLTEDEPLGTAGALALLTPPDEPLLVMNGDILTRVDFHAMLEFHTSHRADLTMAVRPFEIQVPYGVVDTTAERVVRVSEKPVERYLINAGIYLLNPDVCRYVPKGRRYDMTDLVGRLLEEGRRVVSFPIREYWLDIGEQEHYERAQADSQKGGA